MEFRIDQASHDSGLRVFSPRTYTIIDSSSFDVYVRLWGERFPGHNNRSTQQQAQPHIFDVAVVVVVLDRSLYLSPPTLYAQLLLTVIVPSDQQPNPSTASILVESSPVSGLSEKLPPSSFLSISHRKLPESVVQYLRTVITPVVVLYLKDTMPKTQRTANPRHFGLRIKQSGSYCSTTRMKDQHGHWVCWMSTVRKTLDCSAISRSNNSRGTQANLLVWIYSGNCADHSRSQDPAVRNKMFRNIRTTKQYVRNAEERRKYKK